MTAWRDKHILESVVNTLRSEYKDEEIRQRCKDIISYMTEYHMSIRQCAENMMISKSSVHYYIHHYIKELYNDSYHMLVNILKYNSKHKTKPRNMW